MDSVKKELEARTMELERIERRIGATYSNMYAGEKLYLSKSHGTYQYYSLKEGKRVYIPKKERHKAIAMAQQEYDDLLLKKIQEEKLILKHFEKIFAKEWWESCYNSLPRAKQILVNKHVYTNEEYAEEWQKTEYKGNSYPFPQKEIYTDKNERVRSKSEKMIADRLNQFGIPYRYECPLALCKGDVIYPDFTILNVRTRKEWYLEHLGMMSDIGYSLKNIKKIEEYQKNGLWPGRGLLVTYESDDGALDTRLLDKMIREFLL